MTQTKNQPLNGSYLNVASGAGDVLMSAGESSYANYVISDSATPPQDSDEGHLIERKPGGPTMVAGEYLHVKGHGVLVISGDNLVI